MSLHGARLCGFWWLLVSGLCCSSCEVMLCRGADAGRRRCGRAQQRAVGSGEDVLIQ